MDLNVSLGVGKGALYIVGWWRDVSRHMSGEGGVVCCGPAGSARLCAECAVGFMDVLTVQHDPIEVLTEQQALIEVLMAQHFQHSHLLCRSASPR